MFCKQFGAGEREPGDPTNIGAAFAFRVRLAIYCYRPTSSISGA